MLRAPYRDDMTAARTRLMGPEKVMENVEIGVAHDPEGHVIGVIKAV